MGLGLGFMLAGTQMPVRICMGACMYVCVRAQGLLEVFVAGCEVLVLVLIRLRLKMIFYIAFFPFFVGW